MKWLLFVQSFVCVLNEAYSETCFDYDFSEWINCDYGCCGSYYHKYCCKYINVGGIVGGVIGFCIFVAIVATIASCCCCACCPYYRRTRGTIITTTTSPIVTSVPDYQSTGGYSGPYTAKPSEAYGAPPPAYT